MEEIKREDFNNDFIIGVATSSYQIEGAYMDDGKGFSIWDEFTHKKGKILNNDTGDIACDHYHLFREDVDLIDWLGVDSYRFSISWPRIIPEGKGTVNMKGLDFYDRLVDALLDKEISPAVTLYHWDLPAALEGGWLNRDTVTAFVEYSTILVKRLGDRVTMWFTHNEPWCQAFLGYERGFFAPGHTSFKEALLSAHHLLLSHGLAMQALRKYTKAPIGPALNLVPVHHASSKPADLAAAQRFDGYLNRWFTEPIAGKGYPDDMVSLYGELMPAFPESDMDIIAEPIDIMGVNYYERAIIADDKDGILRLNNINRPGPHTADREIYPEGIGEVLTRLHTEYGFNNLIVTENGAAFEETPNDAGIVEDYERIDFFKAHLKEVLYLQSKGVPVKGYFVWSLMDNFEWAQGFSKTYGITHVDFTTQKRTPKKSAEFLRTLKKS
jgi:beta-glucosidase